MPVAEVLHGEDDGDWDAALQQLLLEQQFRASARPDDEAGEPIVVAPPVAGAEGLGELMEFDPLVEAAAGDTARVVSSIRNTGRAAVVWRSFPANPGGPPQFN